MSSATCTPAAIVTAGDTCIDVIGVPQPPAAVASTCDNWRLTGEIRTHYRRGGAFLLADMVASAFDAATSPLSTAGPTIDAPAFLRSGPPRPLANTDFERLTRDEIVHSVLRVAPVKTMPEAKKNDLTHRVEYTLGFSGPEGSDPSLTPAHPDSSAARLLILDDTGNRFRRDADQWRPLLAKLPANALILHKLHRPLPLADTTVSSTSANPLRDAVVASAELHSRTVAVVTIDELRREGMVVSHRLSWESSAIGLIRQLRTDPRFRPLADSRWLIVRFGLDGALVWHQPAATAGTDRSDACAWLVYDPRHLEGGYAATRAGQMVGYGSAFTAGLAVHLADGPPSLEVVGDILPKAFVDGVAAGLAAARALLDRGFGKADPTHPHFEPRYPSAELFSNLKRTAAFHHIPVPLQASDTWTILQTLLPGGHGLADAASTLAIQKKPPAILAGVPLATFGDFTTYDRTEAEAFQSVSNLIGEYLRNTTPKRPLNIAVFGPPGSGKSFGVQQVAKSLAGDTFQLEKIVLNLAQFTSPDQLAVQLHLVRDAVLRGKIPLVFFDEFDASVGDTPLFWLKFLLAPMQDGEFLDHGASHPIGKAIFVFAGGTSWTCDEFAARAGKIEGAKAPDFLSRLRGFLDIKGIAHSGDYRGPALLRRASVLRFQIKEKHPTLFAPDGTLHIDHSVLRAFLFVPDFRHGVRSLEAIVDMSQLAGYPSFAPGYLPSAQQLALHVCPSTAGRIDIPGPGFLDLVAREHPWPGDKIRDAIAQAIHDNYLAGLKALNPHKASHRTWDKLDEFYRDSNRAQADDIPRKLRLLGFDFREKTAAPPDCVIADLTIPALEDKVESAARDEHTRWMAERIRAGWTLGTNDDQILRTHPNLCAWEELNEPTRDYDRKAIRSLPSALAAGGFVILGPEPPPP